MPVALSSQQPTARAARWARHIVATGLVAAAGVAHATPVTWPNPVTEREAYSSYTSLSDNGAVQGYAWGGVSVWNIGALGGTIYSLCVELHAFGWASTYDVTAGLAALAPARQAALTALVDHAMPTFSGLRATYLASSSAGDFGAVNNFALAMQLAVWEIVGETSSTLGLASGQGSFYLPGSVAAAPFNNPVADALAIGFIDNIVLGSWLPSGDYVLGWAASPTAQDQLVIGEGQFGPQAVPEPDSLPLALAGLAVLGFGLMRRKGRGA